MTVVVVDASALLELLLRRPRSDLIGTALAGSTAFAPGHLDAEILSALRGLVRREQVTDARARLAIARLGSAPVERVALAQLLEEAWTLRENLSAYDALYVALARRLRCSLLTADRRLAGAPGIGVSVTLVT